MESKQLLVIGGRGALGHELVAYFKQKNARVVSLDHGKNETADISIVLNNEKQNTSESQANYVLEALKENGLVMEGCEGKVFDAIICVAGGWCGGNIVDKGFLKSVDLMWKQCVESSVVASFLAGAVLKEGGLLVLTGAEAALGPTGGMIGYGIAKAAVHQLIKSLASEASGLPKDSTVIGILPRMLDTSNNRKFASEQDDITGWTPLVHVSELIDGWMTNPPENGGLAVILTKSGATSVTFQ